MRKEGREEEDGHVSGHRLNPDFRSSLLNTTWAGPSNTYRVIRSSCHTLHPHFLRTGMTNTNHGTLRIHERWNITFLCCIIVLHNCQLAAACPALASCTLWTSISVISCHFYPTATFQALVCSKNFFTIIFHPWLVQMDGDVKCDTNRESPCMY